MIYDQVGGIHKIFEYDMYVYDIVKYDMVWYGILDTIETDMFPVGGIAQAIVHMY